MNNLIIYQNGELELNVSLQDETVWLNRHQISELFDRDVKTIGKHINNVFNDGELVKTSVVANFATTATDGKIYNVDHYNLDVIISVGYRVKSPNGVHFRQWATKVLKQYIFNGYAINSEKITQQRLLSLENDVSVIKSHIQNNSLKLQQGIFYDGQIFDAYVFISELIKKAKNSIILINNYIDESTLTLFSKNTKIEIQIYTHTISKQLKLDIEKYNTQYKNLEVTPAKNYHDRFLVIDNDEIYHIGASLKDLGKKIFAFSKIDISIDSTTEPKKVELLVCLGGGDYKSRVEKTLELQKEGYLESDTIIFTGNLEIQNIDDINIHQTKGLKNTYEEVLYVKEYMKKHNLKSATFISEAPHSSRILLFSDIFGEGDFEFNVVASEFNSDSKRYYEFSHMRAYTYSEVLKTFYNIFLYGVADSIGFKDEFENLVSSIVDKQKSEFYVAFHEGLR